MLETYGLNVVLTLGQGMVMVGPMPKSEEDLKLKLDANRGADEGFPKSGSDWPSTSSSMAGFSWRPRPTAGVSGWGIVVVFMGMGLNTDGIAGIMLDADAGLGACMGVERRRTRGRLVWPCPWVCVGASATGR